MYIPESIRVRRGILVQNYPFTNEYATIQNRFELKKWLKRIDISTAVSLLDPFETVRGVAYRARKANKHIDNSIDKRTNRSKLLRGIPSNLRSPLVHLYTCPLSAICPFSCVVPSDLCAYVQFSLFFFLCLPFPQTLAHRCCCWRRPFFALRDVRFATVHCRLG